MDVAGQDDFIPPFAGRQNHALHRACGAADHQKRMSCAESVRRQLFRLQDNRYFSNMQKEGAIKKLKNVRTHSNQTNQNRAPIYEALESFRQMRVVPFDVPGHKRGRGNPELTAFLGQQCIGVDVNSMKPLDNLCHPVSVILEAVANGIAE